MRLPCWAAQLEIAMIDPEPRSAKVFAASRMVSLGSIVASIALPAILFALKAPVTYIYYAAGAALYVVVRHRANIQRILAGKENRL